MDDERVATHYFACTAPGYPGWRWAITVARVPRGKKATVCETNLVPGEGALLSPEWLPYDQRLAPGDLGAGGGLPRIDGEQRPLVWPSNPSGGGSREGGGAGA